MLANGNHSYHASKILIQVLKSILRDAEIAWKAE